MTKLDALVNEVYRDIALMADWWWLVKRQIIATADDISTGTVSVTNNSTSITFSSAPTPSVADRFLLVAGNAIDSGARYRIATHTAAAAAATLDGVYTGATDTVAGYKVYQDSYDLATDFDRPLFIRRYGFPNPMDKISPSEMATLKNFDESTGKPQVYAIYDWETTGQPSATSEQQLILHPYPDAIYRIEVEYRRTLDTELSGSSTPLIPDDYRQILIYGTLARGYVIFLNDSERSAFFQNLFDNLLAKMTQRQRDIDGSRPQIVPADSYRQVYQGRRMINTGRVDLGSYFDRWPFNW